MLPGREGGREDWPLLKPQKEGWTVEKLKEEREKVDTGVLTHHGLLLLTTLLRMEGEGGSAGGGLLATRDTPVMQALRYLWSLHRPSSLPSSLSSYYGAPSMHPPSVLDIPHTRAQADQVLILECLLQYSKAHPTDSEGLVSLLEVFTRPTFTGEKGGREGGRERGREGGREGLLKYSKAHPTDSEGLVSLLGRSLHDRPSQVSREGKREGGRKGGREGRRVC